MNVMEEFKKLPTTAISDAANGCNHANPAIKPIKDHFHIAGRAVTIQVPAGENLAVLKGMREAKPGEVLVVDAKGETWRASAGDFVIGMMQTLGIEAFLVDGAIRDLQAVKDLDFPVFCRGTTPAASQKSGAGSVNVPISFGGLSVSPGDLIIGDADGIVVIPQGQEQEILEKTLDKIKKDADREASITGNKEKIINYLDRMTAP